MNTTVIMHNMIIDICQNSSPEHGISMSRKFYDQLRAVKDFNYEHIYKHPAWSRLTITRSWCSPNFLRRCTPAMRAMALAP